MRFRLACARFRGELSELTEESCVSGWFAHDSGGRAILLTLLAWRVGEDRVAAWVDATAARLELHPAAVTFVDIEDTALAAEDDPDRAEYTRAFPFVPRLVATALVADEQCPPAE